MNKKELFRILDAMQPNVEDVKAYLNRLSGTTPLGLVFRDKQGGFIYRNSVTKDYSFVGILLENTVFYARAFTREDLSLYKQEQNLSPLLVEDIRQWIRDNNDVFPETALPLGQKENDLLQKHRDELETTLEILDFHGLSMPKKEIALLFDDPKSQMCRYSGGDIKISLFIELHADLWICSEKM